MDYVQPLIRPDEIVDDTSRYEIMDLWKHNSSKIKYHMHFCPSDKCSYKDCIDSHHKLYNYPIVRCKSCIDGRCDKTEVRFFNIITNRTLNTRSKFYTVCKRVARILEDKQKQREAKYHPNKEEIVISPTSPLTPVSPVAAFKLPPPLYERLDEPYLPKKEKEQTLSDQKELPDNKKKREREENNLEKSEHEVFYYLNPRKSNKTALIGLVADPDFGGMIKINGHFLAKVLRKMSPEDIISLKLETNKNVGVDAIVELAGARIQNVKLANELAQRSNSNHDD